MNLSSHNNAAMSWNDLQTLVAPLSAFIATNSHPLLLDPQALPESLDPHSRGKEVRVCYSLSPVFFHAESSLDIPLVALLRANARGRTMRAWPLRITVELSYNDERTLGSVWSALVIAAPPTAEREHCVEHVNRLLRYVLRSGYTRALNGEERALFGRPTEARPR